MSLPPIAPMVPIGQYVYRLEERIESLTILLDEQRQVSAERLDVIAAVLKLKSDSGG